MSNERLRAPTVTEMLFFSHPEMPCLPSIYKWVDGTVLVSATAYAAPGEGKEEWKIYVMDSTEFEDGVLISDELPEGDRVKTVPNLPQALETMEEWDAGPYSDDRLADYVTISHDDSGFRAPFSIQWVMTNPPGSLCLRWAAVDLLAMPGADLVSDHLEFSRTASLEMTNATAVAVVACGDVGSHEPLVGLTVAPVDDVYNVVYQVLTNWEEIQKRVAEAREEEDDEYE